MMSQTAIPFVFMRGGTSRGPYFNKDDLPADRDKIADVLISILGESIHSTLIALVAARR